MKRKPVMLSWAEKRREIIAEHKRTLKCSWCGGKGVIHPALVEPNIPLIRNIKWIDCPKCAEAKSDESRN